ncbi:MAG: zinc ribbon domain-containing protein [Planctomycetes bacterium]|nr:zinc ribbon domain-containing protein [Planctomycetota bacterium]NUQ33435.1 zinc ribbon domain-containing protein [Planctomycetaceae bacterium]
MPTYDYQCTACEHQWEEFQSMNDKPLRKCPKCAKLKAKRLISAGAGLIFKGSGFYVTDYKKSGPSKESASKDSGGDSAKPASDATKTDSKPKAASTSKSESAPKAEPSKKSSSMSCGIGGGGCGACS